MPSLEMLCRGYGDRFGLGGRIGFDVRDGAAFLHLTGDGGETAVSLQGAQVLSWRDRKFGEMLWWSSLSPVRPNLPIRGGIPICWPWFGPHPTEASLPQHGLVRTAIWEVIEAGFADGAARARLQTVSAGALLSLDVAVGAALSLTLTTETLEHEPMPITEALHTYFAVGDVGRVRVVGLDGCRYRDRTQNDAAKIQSGDVTIPAETNAHFDETPDVLALVDPVLGRRIDVVRRGGASTVVWNAGAAAAKMPDVPPGGERRYLCIESANIATRAVTVEPGEPHSLGVSYSVGAI